MIRFDGRVALVPGGYGEIGSAVCTGLANLGAKVAVAGRNREKAAACAERLIAQGGGKQVHIGSVRTHLGLRGRGYAAYCAAKGGLAILCKQLAAEWAPHQVNVNAVAPTFVRTDLVAHMLADPKFYEGLVARIPLGRIAEPEDVAKAVLFFASCTADFVTGQTLYLDGRITATQ